MKTSNITPLVGRICAAFIVILTTVFFGTGSVQAGVTFNLHVYQYGQVSGAQTYYTYYFDPQLVTNTAPPSVPFGDFSLTSFGIATNGSSSQWHYDTNGLNQTGGIRNSYGDFNSMVHELTNGFWSLYVTNSASTNVYNFGVKVNITSNDLPKVFFTLPASGAVAVTNQPTYAWSGPTNYSSSSLYSYNTYFSLSLPPTQTTQVSPVVVRQGLNIINVDFMSNSLTALSITSPTNGSGKVYTNLTFASTLDVSFASPFSVGLPDTSGTYRSLVAHYPFEMTNGFVLGAGKDTSGNGYDLNFSNTFGAFGGVSPTNDSYTGIGALVFNDGDGHSGGVLGWTNPTPPVLLSTLAGSFSVSCWVRTTQNIGWNTAPAYYGAGVVSADVGGLANDVIPIALAGGAVAFNTGGNQDDTLNSQATVYDGTYHHIVVTRNQQTGQKIIYIDGIFDSFSSGTTNLLSDPNKLTIGALADAGNPEPNDGSYYQGYDGELDDLQIYSGVLSGSDVATLYNNPGTTLPFGITPSGGHTAVSQYTFDNSGFVGQDATTNQNDIYCSSSWGPDGSPVFTNDAIAGSGAVFCSGIGSLTPCGQSQAFTNWDTALIGSFTLSAWIKTTNTVGNDADHLYDTNGQAVVYLNYNNLSYRGGVIPMGITGSKAAFFTGSTNGGDTLHSTHSVTTGVYTHIVVTRDAVSGKKSIYINGLLDSTDSGPPGSLDGQSTYASIGGSSSDAYTGKLDDVQLYSGVLNSNEVSYLYTHPGQTATNSGLHTSVFQYAFDNSSALGQDATTNHNDISCSSGWGPTQSPVFTNDAIAGAGAAYCSGYGSLVPCDQTFTNWDTALIGSFTLSAWVKTTNAVGNDTDQLYDNNGQSVVYLNYNNLNYRGGVIPMGITGSKAAFFTGSPNGGDTLHSTHSVTTGAYTHIVVTRDAASGQKSIYINGVLDSTDYGLPGPLDGHPDYASIGGSIGDAYVGKVDDVQLYSGVLNASEVAYLYAHPGVLVNNVAGTDMNYINTVLGTTNLNWALSGNTNWFPESTNTPALGVPFAMQSGSVTNYLTSTISVTVTGPGTLSFYWSTIANDPIQQFTCKYDVDGVFALSISGDSAWSQEGPFMIGPGTHILSWTADAYGDTDPTEAAFLGSVNFTPSNTNTAPIITVNPFSQTNYPGYDVALLAAAVTNPPLTWQWFEAGNPTPIPNATNALYIPVNSGTAGVAGSYYAVASNAYGSTLTTTATVTFVTAPLPPDWSRAFKSPFTPVDITKATRDYYYGCLVDSNGNVYAAAEFGGNTTVGASNLNSGTGGDAAAIVKVTPTGSALWAVGITNNGTGNSYAECVALAPGGGIYVSGNFTNVNWLGTNQLTDNGGGDIFVARFDANGSNLWVKTFGGTNQDFTLINCLASDSAGNVTLCGLLGSGPVAIGTNAYNLTGQRGVILQLDQTGKVRWSELSTFPEYLIAGPGRLYASLYTDSTLTTTNVVIGTTTNITDRTWSVACLNATNGQVIWDQGVGSQIGSSQGNPYGYSGGDDVPRLALSGTNLYLTGAAYSSNALFGAISVDFGDLRGQYFARYDTNGNAQTATSYGSVTTTPVTAVANSSGDVYVSGYFDTYSIFGQDDLATPVATRPFVGQFSQGWVAKFDPNGNPLWARKAVSAVTVNFLGIALANDGVWVSGWCESGTYPTIGDTAFGTNIVKSDSQEVGGGAGGSFNIIFYPAGVLAKVTDVFAQQVNLLKPVESSSNFQFSFTSQSGFTHYVQYRTNLVAGTWQTYTNFPGDGTLKTSSLPLSLFSPSKQGFIRVATQ